MLRRFSTNFAVLSIAVDFIVVSSSLWAVNQLRPALSVFSFAKLIAEPPPIPLPMYIAFPVTWIFIMVVFSVYDGRKNIRIVDEFSSLTLSAILAAITLAGILYLTYRETSRITFIFFVLTTYLVQVVWRVIARVIYKRRNELYERGRKILIVGAGPVGRDVEERIKEHAYLSSSVIGFLDDDPDKQTRHADILGGLPDINTVVREKHIDDVVVALPPRAYERLNGLVKELEEMPVKIWVVLDYFNLALHHAEIEDFMGLPMLDLRAPALTEYQRMLKRIFDLIATALILVVALPLMGIVALAIFLDDGQPILFTQKRVGENGRLFKIYKFRTMVKDAEKLQTDVSTFDEQGNLIHKKKDDPRITRIGNFLRRFSLDELPQFYNVFVGNMSLVGPRPELPYLVEKYKPWQRKRFAVPQGITGWWQIHGRSDKPMHLHTEDDLYYVQNYSFWLDLEIIFKTAWIVIRGKGAY
jgi:exopolysaccharide biosynthesis polyprenyl glycosylphosphotransferase